MTSRSTPIVSDDVARSMVWIPAGTFSMGSDDHYPEERPVHRVSVDGFWIDPHPVTNAEFRRFVEETGHVTFAERPPDPRMYPDAKPELLVPGSAVFFETLHRVDLGDCSQWWQYMPEAAWNKPEGPDSSIDGRDDHPVVHVAYEDAEAYARWANKTLPTEAEWERAARGGLEHAVYTWGDEFAPGGKMMANTWQGEFPWQNDLLDGFARTSPVGSFPANGFGLFDMAGNVWEWTSDWFAPKHAAPRRPCCTPVNPRGGTMVGSIDQQLGVAIPRKVLKGGSFLCAPNYCLRYRPAARIPEPIDTTTCHVGFRCVARSTSAHRG
jgi:formylglycine-generating enzyme required for sulfatase activity